MMKKLVGLMAALMVVGCGGTEQEPAVDYSPKGPSAARSTTYAWNAAGGTLTYSVCLEATNPLEVVYCHSPGYFGGYVIPSNAACIPSPNPCSTVPERVVPGHCDLPNMQPAQTGYWMYPTNGYDASSSAKFWCAYWGGTWTDL